MPNARRLASLLFWPSWCDSTRSKCTGMGRSRPCSHYAGASGVSTYNSLAMANIDDIKRAAAERGKKSGLPYAGALSPAEAHALMQAGAALVDVRTRAELDFVGRVPGSEFIEWNSYPEGRLNGDFLSQLAETAEKNTPVMFLCRSGNRSHHAAIAATQAGWRECYNILEGFEGDRDADQHRGNFGGWRKAGLPWVQS